MKVIIPNNIRDFISGDFEVYTDSNLTIDLVHYIYNEFCDSMYYSPILDLKYKWFEDEGSLDSTYCIFIDPFAPRWRKVGTFFEIQITIAENDKYRVAFDKFGKPLDSALDLGEDDIESAVIIVNNFFEALSNKFEDLLKTLRCIGR